MTFQSRNTSFRTHKIQTDTDFSSNLPVGRYAGRVIDLEATSKNIQVQLLLKDKYYQLTADLNTKLKMGDIISFDVETSGYLSLIESLFSPSHFDTQGDALRWRQLGHSVTRMERLRQRHQILQGIRRYFDQQGFLEVDTSVLIKAPSPESQFYPFQTEHNFLITSPEFQMKRMLVGGFEEIYQITPCFRGKEVGKYHNPEFTMLEWYRAFECLESMAKDLEGLFETLADIAPQIKNNHLHLKHSLISLTAPWDQSTVVELFEQYLGINIDDVETVEQLKAKAVSHNLAFCLEGVSHYYDDIFFRLWDQFESRLGHEKPLLVYDWPKPLASLAQLREDNPSKSERMELYIAGVEIANGFGELTDPLEQRGRFEKNLSERQEKGQTAVPLDEKFLESLSQGMPPSAGMALGVDRLVMLLTGADQIRDVLSFSYNEL